MPTHAETRLLPHAPEFLFDLVADIERYPEFLPWCVACRIRRREGNVLWGDLAIGFRMLREQFTSRVTLDRPGRIDVAYIDGPFRRLDNHWIFRPAAAGTEVDFFIDFEFKSKLLQRLMEPVFNEAVRRMVHAFEIRANSLANLNSSQ
ncbi:MAG: type II toxin-antitoxin system RatA family toxin [Alphaproteobacteria bacterium]|nr:type II toxin-antitoxin system RatA family toxin [Alphaproteobacteria bacterium]